MAKNQDSVSVDWMEKIDAITRRFEADWRAGKAPKIEDFVSKASGSGRAELLRTLLQREVSLRAGAGQAATAADYAQRFPQDAIVVQSVLRDWQRRQQAGETVDRPNQASATVSLEQPAPPGSFPPAIGRFTVSGILGQGAFGIVYRALDPHLEREVAIKVPLKGSLENQEDIDRFLKEARAAATIQHPNICAVHEVGQEDGQYFIVMSFIEGKSLSEQIKERKEPMPGKQAALIVRKLALALDAAHAKGIVHRDLKPANIMVDKHRKDVVIMDFGLARHRKPGDATQTREGVMMGTPAYMAPEQARGQVQQVGPASDIYSLGVILYEMLAGRIPFLGSITEVLGQLILVEPEPPSKHRPATDPRLEAICLKAMAKDPAKRHRTMKELAVALGGFLQSETTGDSIVPVQAADPIVLTPIESVKAEKSSVGMSTLVKKLSVERKRETKRAIEEAVRKSRIPSWQIFSALGFLAVILLGGVIILFTRSGNTLVQIVLETKIDPELLKDGTIKYSLDGKSLSVEELKRPIELVPGEHVLLAKRGDVEVQRYVFVVASSRDGKEATIQIKEKTPYLPPPETSVPAGWIPWFSDGDVSGWQGLTQFWRVEKGALIGSTKPGGLAYNTYFVSKDKFKDFELKFQVRLLGDKANSGVQIRSDYVDAAKFILKGPQADMGDMYWGSLYGERSGGMMQHGPKDASQLQLKKDDFNDYYIKCVGERVTIKVNGEPTVDREFPGLPATGFIGWQIHSGGPMEVTFRNVLFRNLSSKPVPPTTDNTPPPGRELPPLGVGWRTLYDGTDLLAWMQPDGQAPHWKRVGDAMEATAPTHLVTREKFMDFDLHVEFWVPLMKNAQGQGRGNSGVYLLGRHEVQILDSYQQGPPTLTDCAALYKEIAPSQNVCKPPEEWQTYDIQFQAPRISGGITPGRLTVVHNGVKVIDNAPFVKPSGGAVDKNIGEPGPIVLQWHSGAVRFRNIQIRPWTK